MNMIELLQKLPPGFRTTLYALYALAGFALGLFKITGAPFGMDLATAAEVLVYCGIAFGIVATANAPGVRAVAAKPHWNPNAGGDGNG